MVTTELVGKKITFIYILFYKDVIFIHLYLGWGYDLRSQKW